MELTRGFISIAFMFSIALAFSLVVNDKTSIFQIATAQSRPSKDTGPSIVAVTFDKMFVEKWCPVSKSPMALCPLGGDKVRVTTVVDNKDNDPILYSYKVSGGKIIGQGSNIVWDLANVVPGWHSIIVTATDASQRKTKSTKTIELRECSICDMGCQCPELSLTASKDFLSPGEKVKITASLVGPFRSRTKYSWTVKGGKIIGGSKARSIRVLTSKDPSETKLTATVEISDTDPRCNCLTATSVEIAIVSKVIHVVTPPNSPR